jgi:outer membrane cobalamin receptor
MFLKSVCAATFSTALLTGLAVAQNPTPPAHPVAPAESVTVTAEPIPLDSLAGSTTTLDHDAITSSGARSTDELFRFLPSVHYSQQQGKGSLSTVAIRGGKPNYTLVLVDGIPANDIGDQLGGAFNFASLDVNQVERIDVYRGPLSTLYGSEAIGGVINVVLRNPASQPRFHFQSEGGQYGYVRGLAGFSGQLSKFALSGSSGFSRVGEQVLNDGSTLGTATVAADRTLSPSALWHTFAQWNRLSFSSLPIGSGGPIYALSKLPEKDASDQVASGATFQQKVTKRWSYTATGGIFSRVGSDDSPAILDSKPPGPGYIPSSVSHTRFLRIAADTVHDTTPASWLNSYTTLSFLRESGTTVGELGGFLPGSYQLTRSTLNLAETANAHRGRAAITAGVNLEKASSYGPVISSHAGGLLLAANYQWNYSFGQGFKLPSFYALSNPLIGNPALKPEYSTAFDAGVTRKFTRSGTGLQLSAFNNSYRNVIDFSSSAFKLVNRENEFSRGADLTVEQQIRRLNLSGSVTYLDAGFKDTSARLRDVPRWSEQFQARMPFGASSSLEVATIWVGRRFDYQVPVPQIETVPRYTMTSVAYRRVLAKRIQATVRLENVLDSHYQEFIGFPSAGIYASGGVSYSVTRPRSPN